MAAGKIADRVCRAESLNAGASGEVESGTIRRLDQKVMCYLIGPLGSERFIDRILSKVIVEA